MHLDFSLVSLGLLWRIHHIQLGLLQQKIDTNWLLLLAHEHGVEAARFLNCLDDFVRDPFAVKRVLIRLVLQEHVTGMSVHVRGFRPSTIVLLMVIEAFVILLIIHKEDNVVERILRSRDVGVEVGLNYLLGRIRLIKHPRARVGTRLFLR